MILLICFSVPAALAQSDIAGDVPANREDILKMFNAMNTQDQLRQVMEEVMQRMRSINREQLKQRRPEISEEELASIDKESEEVAKSFPVTELLEDMVPVYQKHLSKADTDAIVSFYSSPTGQKLLREMPALMSEGMQAAYPRMQKNLDAIMQRMDEKARQEQQSKEQQKKEQQAKEQQKKEPSQTAPPNKQ
jgi:hypothetical protein